MKPYKFIQIHSIKGKEIRINREVKSNHPKAVVWAWLKEKFGNKIEMR